MPSAVRRIAALAGSVSLVTLGGLSTFTACSGTGLVQDGGLDGGSTTDGAAPAPDGGVGPADATADGPADAGPPPAQAACGPAPARAPNLDRLGERYATFIRVDQLLAFDPNTDPRLPLYTGLAPLASRKARTDKLEAHIAEVMALLNYDSAADPKKNPPQIGTVPPDERSVFEGWNLIDVYGAFPSFGEMAATGSIMVPTPQEIHAGHKNGVRVLGSVFFGEDELAEQLQFCQLTASEAADALEGIADTYGFDGWVLNLEAVGGMAAADVVNLRAIMRLLKERNVYVTMYDSLATTSARKYYNQLEAANLPLFDDATAFFTNYWWTIDAFETSATTAGDRAADVFMGIGWWPGCCDGDPRPIDGRGALQALRQFGAQGVPLSAGLWAAQFPLRGRGTPPAPAAYAHRQLVPYWFSVKPEPTTQDPAVSDVVTPKTPIVALPFDSSFNIGRGDARFENGARIASAPWGNLVEQDIVVHALGQTPDADVDYDFTTACWGGSSLGVTARRSVEVPVYLTAVPMPETLTVRVSYTLTGAPDASTQASLVLALGGRTERIALPPAGVFREVTAAFPRSASGEELGQLAVQVPAGTTLRLGRLRLQ